MWNSSMIRWSNSAPWAIFSKTGRRVLLSLFPLLLFSLPFRARGEEESAASLAQTLTASLDSRAKKIAALCLFVRDDIAYGDHGRKRERRPTPDGVLKRGEGTCFDQVRLLGKMLEAIGEKPYYLGVREKFPGHIVLLVRADPLEAQQMAWITSGGGAVRWVRIPHRDGPFVAMDPTGKEGVGFPHPAVFDFEGPPEGEQTFLGWKTGHNISPSLRAVGHW